MPPPPKSLHIISLDVPYPADYGGVYDLFYKLPALKAQGVKIFLHCFNYGRGPQPELKKYCEQVNYYRREAWGSRLLSGLPYIVASRRNEQLAANLLKDDFPILMEGVHCTFPLLDKRFNGRKKLVRLHNVEHEYYRQLFHRETNPLKKLYFWYESRLLKKYESAIAKMDAAFWAVSEKDAAFYRDSFGCTLVDYLPLFLPGWKVSAETGAGAYCLYHGNLKVAENEKAAIWLVKEVFKKEIPLVIAGKTPSKKLQKLVKQNPAVSLIGNPTENEMQDLIAKAQINVLPSFSETGIKLKLINALFNGKHCVANSAMVSGTGLESLCNICEDAVSMQKEIERLFHQPFGKEETALRKKVLNTHFNNETNAKQIVQWIWGE